MKLNGLTRIAEIEEGNAKNWPYIVLDLISIVAGKCDIV
jgi:hypothetical protein